MNGTIMDYGGNVVRRHALDGTGMVEFAGQSAPYRYYLVILRSGEAWTIEGLASFTVFCLRAVDVELAGAEEILQQGDSIQVENRTVVLRAVGGEAHLLVAGVVEGVMPNASMAITRSGLHYKLVKPWGHEKWFNGDHPAYCLKEVYITAGNRTSLQYHNFKEETNALFGGAADLVFRAAEDAERLDKVRLTPLATIHVTPTVVHRLESVQDTLLYEVSTPHLDDVIRLQDDLHRPGGRILAEHRGNHS